MYRYCTYCLAMFSSYNCFNVVTHVRLPGHVYMLGLYTKMLSMNYITHNNVSMLNTDFVVDTSAYFMYFAILRSWYYQYMYMMYVPVFTTHQPCVTRSGNTLLYRGLYYVYSA